MTENKLFPFPGVQLVKCSVIVNGAEEAADCEKERGMGRVSYWSPALSYRASFFKLNVGKTACPRNLVLGRIFPRWMCHWSNLIFFYFYCSGTLWATCYNSSSTRRLVRQPDIRDLCIPAPSTSLKKRERRSGKYWQRCGTFCWYACSFSYCWTTVVLRSMKKFLSLVNVILIFLLMTKLCLVRRTWTMTAYFFNFYF